MRTENEIAQEVVRAALQIHRVMGPGLLEHVYEKLMVVELRKSKLGVRAQVGIPVIYEGEIVTEIGFRADLIIENKVLVELKSTSLIMPVHHKQVLTYLKLTKLKLGLLINFNEELLLKGVKRIANNL